MLTPSASSGSIKQECLDRVIPLGERHFRQALSEYVAHYHHDRNHQGLGNLLIDGIVPKQRQVGSVADHDSVVS